MGRTKRPSSRADGAIQLAQQLARPPGGGSPGEDREDWLAGPGAPVWLDAGAINRNAAGVEAIGLFMDVVMVIWLPGKRPIAFDAARLARRLNRRVPDRGYTAEEVRRLKPALATFFTPLADGRWTPRPEYLAPARWTVDGPLH